MNCTISGNYLSSGMSSSCSGGIYNSGNLNIEYCTITDNTFSSYISEGGSNGPNRSYKASGIYNKGVLSLKGTILAHNGPSDIYYSYYGGVNYVEEADGITTTPIKDYGYNVIGVNNGLNLKTTNNILGSSNDFYDPFLERLKNNGGFSETHALSDSSRCIDAGGTSATVLVDQRGVLRSKPDVGAFEHVYEPWSVGTSIVYSDWNDLKLTATFNHKETRLEVTHVPGYKKLKLGYDNIGLYHANKNVISGGNDTLEILLYSYGIVDWNRIEIRPNGSTSNPISLGKYVDNFGSLPYHLKIPLSDFDSSIDFSQLILLEFPYSNNANSFKINIHKIAFTGGTEPFLWFGDGKVDNKFDGGGTGGQLLAKLYMQTSLDQIAKVEYFANSVKIGESSTAPFTFDWEDVESGEFEFVTVAHTVHGSILRSSPYKVNVGTRVYREATEESIESTQVEVYPNPIVDILNIKSANQNARVVIRDINGAIQYQVRYYNLQNGQADISSLPSGLYFLKLEDEGNVSNKVIKLIKQ
ncbi:MAG: T9SS type A sorting domain-containing protein [Sporocytophaga sp.]|nr:T9SS type A sorting domain-containing protein [Sporocytophaga sp.]